MTAAWRHGPRNCRFLTVAREIHGPCNSAETFREPVMMMSERPDGGGAGRRTPPTERMPPWVYGVLLVAAVIVVLWLFF